MDIKVGCSTPIMLSVRIFKWVLWIQKWAVRIINWVVNDSTVDTKIIYLDIRIL
jgi:hypothetical protein